MKKIVVWFLVTCLLLSLSISALAEGDSDRGEGEGEPGSAVSEEKQEIIPEITKGVFLCEVTRSRRILLKFYEDGTFYLEGIMGGAWRGTYVVREKHVSYYEPKPHREAF